MLAGMPYVVWPIGSLFILASNKKDDPFLHYHAVQALLAGAVLGSGFFLLMLGLFVSFRVMPGTSTYIPAFFSMGFLLGGGALVLGLLLTAVFLGWRATEGEMLRLPFIGDYAEDKMLDHTGMTRRQFEAMLVASMAPENQEEEIPFPELKRSTSLPQSVETTTPKETAMDRLEAARRARAARENQARAQQETRVETAPESRQTRDLGHHAPRLPQNWEQPARQAQPSRPTAPSTPVVRDVDLIGHYKEKKIESGPDGKNRDVLKNWLSSVDGES